MLQRLSCFYFWFKPYLPQMKEKNQIIFWKGLFTSIKRHLCLTREHMANLGLVEVESPLIRSCFWQVWSKLRNLFFFFPQKEHFKKVSDPWRLYLSKIGPDIFLEKQEFRQAGYQYSLMEWFSKLLLRA